MDETIGWIAIFGTIAIIVSVYTFLVWLKWREKRINFLRAIAIDHYVETGEKTAAFRSIPSSHLKAIETKRGQRIRERIREHTTFETVCSCPSCNDLNLHYFEIGQYEHPTTKNLTAFRECRNCGFKWREPINNAVYQNRY
jgi:DNA-directed RNA polymerase subunit M/transcription elongation factor TFIIS